MGVRVNGLGVLVGVRVGAKVDVAIGVSVGAFVKVARADAGVAVVSVAVAPGAVVADATFIFTVALALAIGPLALLVPPKNPFVQPA